MTTSAINRQPFQLWDQPTRGFSIKNSLAQLVTQVYTRIFPTTPPAIDYFAEMPDELKVALLSRFDLPLLAQFSITAKSPNSFVSDHQVWRSIAKQIDCPINNKSSLPIYHQVLRFIDHLRDEIIKIDNRPADITLMMKAPTINEINYIQKSAVPAGHFFPVSKIFLS